MFCSSFDEYRYPIISHVKCYFYFCRGHQEILRGEGKCNQFDPVPLVLVKDIMNYMPQMKYMFNNIAATTGTEQPSSKRARVS